MEAYRLIEETQGQAGDMQAMDFRSMATAGQCDDGAPPQVGDLRFCFEPFAVTLDKVVDDAFANGLVAQNEFVSPCKFHQAPQDHCGWKEGVHASRI